MPKYLYSFSFNIQEFGSYVFGLFYSHHIRYD